ncbi:hypothetical protein F9C07_5271 [Aspergillus flavus]|uniref:Uncharacterized protein n=1 Tax=Aspergillus flavus (strain ATCC 200026 / FGSC A1120 / IAM 13836 / NRRL 3357 / JCM 12722 / SRRC 167) TaxID=332952 RepID=A0A7U2MWM6_ASPFN|nr:hypothetical protein F9C07_5271 [Aspergillus flavus]
MQPSGLLAEILFVIWSWSMDVKQAKTLVSNCRAKEPKNTRSATIESCIFNPLWLLLEILSFPAYHRFPAYFS